MIRITKLKTGIGAVAILFIVLVAVGFKIYRDKLYVNLPRLSADQTGLRGSTRTGRSNSGNGSHHADQGTQTVNIPYEWFVALEQPRLALWGTWAA